MKTRVGDILDSLALSQLWSSLVWPLARLLLGMSGGLLIAAMLESSGWSAHLARLAAPVSRLAHLNHAAATAFALAFVSSASANALLAEKYDAGRISRKELFLANFFNSLPTFATHLPTIFFMFWPVLGLNALVYVGLTLLAAIARTLFTVILGRMLLPEPHANVGSATICAPQGKNLQNVFVLAWKRFRKRLPRLVLFTVPFYILTYIGQKAGFFNIASQWLAVNLNWLSFIKPEAMGIIVLQLVAEMGASLGAAGAIMSAGSLSGPDVVTALLVGNVLAAPMRAIRHQLPAYAGFYKPVMAMKIVVANQLLRTASVALCIWFYVMFFVK